MKVLALDLGTNMGWFRAAAVGPAEFGTCVLSSSTDLGIWLRSADGFLRELLPSADRIVVEKPDTAGLSYFGIRKNMALLGHVHWWARTLNRSIATADEISVSTAKLTLAGHGRAEKDQMVAAARERGYAVETDHEADACALWHVAVFGAAKSVRKGKPRSSKGVSAREAGLL